MKIFNFFMWILAILLCFLFPPLGIVMIFFGLAHYIWDDNNEADAELTCEEKVEKLEGDKSRLVTLLAAFYLIK